MPLLALTVPSTVTVPAGLANTAVRDGSHVPLDQPEPPSDHVPLPPSQVETFPGVNTR